MSELDPIVQGMIRGRLTPIPGSTVTNNKYGVDSLVRRYFGFTDEIYKLLPKKGITRDAYIKTMLCDSYKVTEGKGLTSEAEVTYIGLVDDKLPPVNVTGGWSEQTVQLSTTTRYGTFNQGPIVVGYPEVGTAGDGLPTKMLVGVNYNPVTDDTGEASIIYHSPESTFVYLTKKKPTAPKYFDTLQVGTADFSIKEVRPNTISGRIVYAMVIRTVRFDVVRAGLYWQITETTRGTLTSAKVLSGFAGALGFAQKRLPVFGTR